MSLTYTQELTLREGDYTHRPPLSTRAGKEVEGKPEPPRSYLFICPTCGEVWAKADITYSRLTREVKRTPYQLLAIGCGQHPQHSQEIGGSLWLSWDSDFTDSLSQDFLYRELFLHLKPQGT